MHVRALVIGELHDIADGLRALSSKDLVCDVVTAAAIDGATIDPSSPFDAVFVAATGDVEPLRVIVGSASLLAVGAGPIEARARGFHDGLDAADASLSTLTRVLASAFDAARSRRDTERAMTIVSHDLRNPLNVITVAAASLRSGTVPEAKLGSYLEKVSRAADRMNRLIQDVVDSMRLDIGVVSLTRTREAPNEVLAEVVKHVQAQADAKSLALVSDAADGLPEVSVDRARLVQALTKLGENAIQVTSSGGTVRLRARADDAHVAFEVVDHGPGIAEPRLSTLIAGGREPLGAARRGPGLGLRLARRIAELHGGALAASSVEGAGATFQVRIPR